MTIKPSPGAFEDARAAMEAQCRRAADVLSLDNADWNGPDHRMVSDLWYSVEKVVDAAREFNAILNQAMDGTLPIEKVVPF